MIRNHSSTILNLVKRSGTVHYDGLNRLFNACDSKGFNCSVTSTDQKPNLFLKFNPQAHDVNRLFCSIKRVHCWQCGSKFEEGSSVSCSDCLAPQLNHSSLNYYTLFNQELTYDVNVPEIRQKYLSLQRVLHPDRFTNRPQDDQKISSDLSTFVNKAYKVLINPYERGIYLLKLNGIHREENEGNYIMDPDFLEDMLSINEAVLESGTEGLQDIRSDVQSKVNQLVILISKGFESKSLKDVELLLNKLKFYVNILDKITEKE